MRLRKTARGGKSMSPIRDIGVHDGEARLSRRRRGLGLLAGAGALALVCVGLTTAASANVGAAKPTLTIGTAFGCGDVSPLASSQSESPLVYEGLLRTKTDGFGATQGLAIKWGIRPGNKVITFTLRRNARFSDGSQVTAQAVKAWFDWRGTQIHAYDSTVGPFRSAEVLSKWVVRLTLKSPNPVLADALAASYPAWGTVVSPQAIKVLKSDPKSTILSRQTFGAGQYVYVPSQSVTGDHCTYVPNRYYYDKSRVKWGKVIVRTITDANAALAALKTGQIDVNMVGSVTIAQTAAAAGFRTTRGFSSIRMIGFWDLGGKLVRALADVRVRQALNYAIDRKTITRGLFGPRAIPTSIANPARDGGADRKYSNYYAYNPGKARALLSAAGYSNGFTFNVLCPGAWYPLETGPLCAAVARDLAAIGVTLDVNVVSAPDFGAGYASKSYAAWAINLGSITTFEWYGYVYGATRCCGDQHDWRDPVTDKLWLKGLRANKRKGAETWRELTEREVKQAYFLPVARIPTISFVSKRVGGATDAVWSINDPTYWYPTGK